MYLSFNSSLNGLVMDASKCRIYLALVIQELYLYLSLLCILYFYPLRYQFRGLVHHPSLQSIQCITIEACQLWSHQLNLFSIIIIIVVFWTLSRSSKRSKSIFEISIIYCPISNQSLKNTPEIRLGNKLFLFRFVLFP